MGQLIEFALNEPGQQADFIASNADPPGILMLNEVTTVQPERWHDLLPDDLGYRQVVDPLDWAAELRESEVPPHHDFLG